MPEIDTIKQAVGRAGQLKGIRTDLELVAWMARNQIPRDMADKLFQRTDLPARIQRQVVPKATYHRNKFLSTTVMERLLRIARLFTRAQAIFDGDRAAAASFLVTPHPLLDDKTPAELAITEPGYQAADSILRQIELGLPV
jgi:putative toxin-antitoxin system antitoxin component (TIGR02293 family)